MQITGLPASLASEENVQGFSVFVSFLLSEQALLHVPFSSVVVVVVHFVADLWVCDKAISTTPATRQLTPSTKKKPVKMKTLECRRFTCLHEAPQDESCRIRSQEIEFSS